MVITTLNEGKRIRNTLETLLQQTVECNIIVVDSCSTDSTEEEVRSINSPRIIFEKKRSSRGKGRNIGVDMASSNIVLFTDGDATPSKNWVEEMSNCLKTFDLVVGKTLQKGPKKYSKFKRVELVYKGFEITAPSMNMGIRRDVFLKVGGFDDRMVTAEDIDLNLRILMSDNTGTLCEKCVVTHNSRENLVSFLRQAYWNGYGRAQLKFKNKTVFNEIEKGKIEWNEVGIIWFMRNVSAIFGYLHFLLLDKRKF